MNFGKALDALKQGKKVGREGWNGKGMFIYVTTGSVVPVVNLKPETSKHLFGNSLLECDVCVEIKPHIDMKSADGSITIGWNPSQPDMFAEDWQVII